MRGLELKKSGQAAEYELDAAVQGMGSRMPPDKPYRAWAGCRQGMGMMPYGHRTAIGQVREDI